MANTGNGFAIANNVVVTTIPTTFDVAWNGVVSDGVSQSFCVTGSFFYDSTQPVSTAIAAFKASVAACALVETGLTIPIANILVSFGVN